MSLRLNADAYSTELANLGRTSPSLITFDYRRRKIAYLHLSYTYLLCYHVSMFSLGYKSCPSKDIP